MNSAQNTVNWRSDSHALKKFQFIHHFLPNPSSKKRATLLSTTSIIIYCLLVFSLGMSIKLVPFYLPGILGYAANISTSELLNQTNQQRASNGLPPLKLNAALSQAAANKANHMFKNNYWAHIAPDGTDPWDFILGSGYDYVYAGENLAKNFSSSKDVVNAWMKSPSHKQNLMNNNYQDIGFAVVNGVLNGYETTLVVQMFGKPRAARPVEQVYQKTTPEKPAVAINPRPTQVKDLTAEVVEQPVVYQQIKVDPIVDVRKASRVLSMAFGGFMLLLLSLDVWYSQKQGIVKVTGHTLAHIAFLIIVLLSIWFVIKPGAIL